MKNPEKSRISRSQEPQRKQKHSKIISLIAAGVSAVITWSPGCKNSEIDRKKSSRNCSTKDKNNDLTDKERLAVSKYSKYRDLKTAEAQNELFEAFRLADEALLNNSRCMKVMEEIKNRAKKELDKLEKIQY